MITLSNPNSLQTITYVALGDSLSSGVGSNDYKKTITYIFANHLSEIKKNSVNFYNFAFSGATTDDLINKQLEEAIKINPDYITLFIGTNDIHSLIPAKKFEENIKIILDNLSKKTKAKIIVFNLPYLGFNNLILPPYDIFFDIKIRQFNSILEKICLQKNLILVDLYTPTKNDFSKEANFYSADEFHPSEKGYLLWGSLIISNNY